MTKIEHEVKKINANLLKQNVLNLDYEANVRRLNRTQMLDLILEERYMKEFKADTKPSVLNVFDER